MIDWTKKGEMGEESKIDQWQNIDTWVITIIVKTKEVTNLENKEELVYFSKNIGQGGIIEQNLDIKLKKKLSTSKCQNFARYFHILLPQ